MAEELKPCPFCGHKDIAIVEGTSSRWRVAECSCCGAQCGEVRIRTLGEGTKEEKEDDARIEAIATWNKRA